MEEKELFEDYEFKVWKFTPNVYKIIGISILANFLGLFAIGQFNLFTTRGCDAPYVGIVCQVLDSAYVASVFLGKNNEWDSRAYTVTEIGDGEEVTFIDVSDQLQYPEGYFAKEETPENLTKDANGNPIDLYNPTATIPSKTPDEMGVQVLPTPNEVVKNQKLPDSPWGNSDKKPSFDPSIGKKTPKKPAPKNSILGDSPKTLPDDETMAGTNKPKKENPKPDPSPTPNSAESQAEFNKTFNKKPLQDFADGVIAKIDSPKPEEKVDLKQSFKVVLDGTLTEDGKFDAKKTKFVGKPEGNEQMVKVAKDAIAAIGDSNLFIYLRNLGVEKVSITLVQDDKQISAIIRSDQPNEQRARTISSGFNGLIAATKLTVKEEDVKMLLNASKVTAEGKSFILNFALPKEEAHKLIEQKLQEARQKKLQNNNGEGVKESTVKG